MADDGRGKLHSACDECRTRKLRCSRTFPLCTRCERDGLACVYSPQKQMGRPRKRRRDDTIVLPEPQAGGGQVSTDFDMSAASSSSNGFSVPFQLDDIPGFAELEESDFGFHEATLATDNGMTTAYPPASCSDLSNTLEPNTTTWNLPPSLQLTDPSLPDPSAQIPCACIPSMYLTIISLQNMTDFLFPAIILPLRSATTTAATILDCESCYKQPFSMMQNMLSLISLLTAIAERWHKALAAIDSETQLLETTGQKKAFRLGDADPNLVHLHTGTPDCPMAFTIDLEPKEWRKLSKRAIKSEVFGGSTNPNPLVALLDRMEERQHRWHRAGNVEAEKMFGPGCGKQNEPVEGRDAHCVRLITQVRRMVGSLDWS